MTRKHGWISIATALLFLLVGCTGQRARMEQVIREAKEQNLNYVPFTTDSLLREAVAYYDRHGTANERLLAHYLLGCTYRDLNEAPLAIITWEDAVACADTLSPDCDYATLFRVYGQMAEIYMWQHLPEKELEAEEDFSRFALQAGDTLNYIRGLLLRNTAYYALGDTAAIFQNTEFVRQQYLQRGLKCEAAQIYPTAIHVAVECGLFERAASMMQTYEMESGLFDKDGNVVDTLRIQFHYYKGLYYMGIGTVDSAELQFRKLLPIRANAIDGYRGLLSVYHAQGTTDSIFKYARLYEDALIQHLNQMQTTAIVQAEGMYDYHRQELQAQIQARRVRLMRLVLLCVVVFVFLGCACVYGVYRQKKAREERKLNQLTASYSHAMEERNQMKNEVFMLQQSLSGQETLKILLEEKVRKIHLLEEHISWMQSQLSSSSPTVLVGSIMDSDIVRQFHTIARCCMVKTDDHSVISQARPASETEWKQMEEAVRLYHPRFYLFITEEHRLSKLELKVCILSRLRFEKMEMATLLNVHKQSVTNARTSLAKKLFSLSSAYDLDSNLFDI